MYKRQISSRPLRARLIDNELEIRYPIGIGKGTCPPPLHRVSLSIISSSLSMIIRIAVIRFNVLIVLSCLPLFWCHKKRKSFYGKSKLAANKAYDDFVARLYTERAPEPGSIPFKALAEEWLETYKRDAVRNVTLEKTYESPLNRHILPYFGTMLVARITETDKKILFRPFSFFSFIFIQNARYNKKRPRLGRAQRHYTI